MKESYEIKMSEHEVKEIRAHERKEHVVERLVMRRRLSSEDSPCVGNVVYWSWNVCKCGWNCCGRVTMRNEPAQLTIDF